MSITKEKLLEIGFSEQVKDFFNKIGFKPVEDDGSALIFHFEKNTDRFSHFVIFDVEDNEFYFFRDSMSSDYRETDENDIMTNHNNLNTHVKNQWMEIKEKFSL